MIRLASADYEQRTSISLPWGPEGVRASAAAPLLSGPLWSPPVVHGHHDVRLAVADGQSIVVVSDDTHVLVVDRSGKFMRREELGVATDSVLVDIHAEGASWYLIESDGGDCALRRITDGSIELWRSSEPVDGAFLHPDGERTRYFNWLVKDESLMLSGVERERAALWDVDKETGGISLNRVLPAQPGLVYSGRDDIVYFVRDDGVGRLWVEYHLHDGTERITRSDEFHAHLARPVGVDDSGRRYAAYGFEMASFGPPDRVLRIEGEGAEAAERCQAATSWCVFGAGEIVVPCHTSEELQLVTFEPIGMTAD